MQNLRIYDIARLDLTPSDPRYRELESFLNKLRIKMQTGPRPKTRTIYGLEPQAGRYVFMKDNNKETTVAVGLRVRSTLSLSFPNILL